MLNKSLFSSNKQDWETPIQLFKELDDEFHFTIDACANEKNHLCDFYYDENVNFLLSYPENEVIFCNPPYNQIEDFVIHCRFLSLTNTVVMLIPARTDTKWFHDFIYEKDDVQIRFLKGRLKFLNNGKPCNSAPFPSMVVVFNKRRIPCFDFF